jgi:hypothetical protein
MPSDDDFLAREGLVEHIWEWLEDYENGWKRTPRYFTPIARDAGVKLRGSRLDIDHAGKELAAQVRNASTDQLLGYWEHWNRVAQE